MRVLSSSSQARQKNRHDKFNSIKQNFGIHHSQAVEMHEFNIRQGRPGLVSKVQRSILILYPKLVSTIEIKKQAPNDNDDLNKNWFCPANVQRWDEKKVLSRFSNLWMEELTNTEKYYKNDTHLTFKTCIKSVLVYYTWRTGHPIGYTIKLSILAVEASVALIINYASDYQPDILRFDPRPRPWDFSCGKNPKKNL